MSGQEIERMMNYLTCYAITVMIRFSARALIYFWHLNGGRLFETGRLFGKGRLFNFFEKQPNAQKKTLINIKITNKTETVTLIHC